jgi:hypothetical protein
MSVGAITTDYILSTPAVVTLSVLRRERGTTGGAGPVSTNLSPDVPR